MTDKGVNLYLRLSLVRLLTIFGIYAIRSTTGLLAFSCSTVSNCPLACNIKDALPTYLDWAKIP